MGAVTLIGIAIQVCLLALGPQLSECNLDGAIQLLAPNGDPVVSYQSALYWNTRRIVIEPPIRAVIHRAEGDTSAKLICGFQLHQRGSIVAPVEIRLSNPVAGTGHLFPKDGVDLSVYGGDQAVKTNNATDKSSSGVYFDFDISAFDCERPVLRSSRIPVMLRVTEWESPKFTQPDGYTARVPQAAAVGTSVLQIAAFELHKSADICRYEIEHEPPASDGEALPAVPFDIDGNGKIRVKTPLIATEREQHFNLRVTASDCGVPESRKSYVRVLIVAYPSESLSERTLHSEAAAALSATWLDVPKKLVYPASGGVKIFAPLAALSTPAGASVTADDLCKQSSAVVKISVQSTAWDQACQRSVRSLYEQRSACQVNSASVDLLNPHFSPASDLALPNCKCCKAADIAAAELKKKLLLEQRTQQPMEHRSFDGVQYYMDVPADVVHKSHQLGQQFTLHFWLRHGSMAKDSAKEQILCSADESGHNRHHYSVFLHNCKLILLLRQEFNPTASAGDSGKESAAEWRFRLGEVCDSSWHHYAISYSGGRVKLVIDGRIFAATADNPQILDDYPMHRSPVTATRLTIGACWHGSSGIYRQFLKGSLAGLVLLRNSLESDTVIHCLNQCHEKLDFSTKTQLEPGMSVSLNADYTMIEIKGRNATEVARLLRSIGYINVRKEGAAAASLSEDKVKRSIRLDTAVTCTNPKATVTVDPVSIAVEVSDPSPEKSQTAASVLLGDRLCISGPNILRYQVGDLASPSGVKFLQGLEIALTAPKTLDACVLRTSPDFTAVESLIWPAGRASDAGVEGRVDQRQLLLEGYAGAEVYQSLLSGVAYSNMNPIIRYRSFVLTCSVRGGEIVSNEFVVKLSVLHPDPSDSHKNSVKKQLPDPTPVAMPLPSVDADDVVSLAASAGLRNRDGLDDASHHHMAAESHAVKSAGNQFVQRPHQDADNGAAAAVSASTPIAPIVIGLATAGLLILALGLMYMRYRRSAQSAGPLGRGSGGSNGKVLPVDAESQAEMEWDNSALNITVNPLDNEEENDAKSVDAAQTAELLTDSSEE